MRLPCLLIALALCQISSAGADIIYDNGLELTNADFSSFSFTSTSTGAQYQIADDFLLGGGTQWAVDGARWSGIIIDNNAFQLTIGETFDFDVLIFADNGGVPTGTPLDPVPGTAIAARQATATGADNGVFKNGADFVVSFDPVILDGGTTYWIVFAARDDFSYINNIVEDGRGWAWIGRSGTGNAWQGGTNFQNNWFQQGRQQDFQLFGRAIPEPSSAIGLGFIAIGAAVIRRRRAC